MDGLGSTNIIIYVLFFVGVFYLLLIRPQRKYAKTRETLISGLRVQDRIVTAGGLRGMITAIKSDSVLVSIADNVEVEILKTGIMNVDAKADNDDEDVDLDEDEDEDDD